MLIIDHHQSILIFCDFSMPHANSLPLVMQLRPSLIRGRN